MTPPDRERARAPETDDALARLAAEAVPDVLAAALARARTDAVARLAALLTDEIVAQAQAEHRRRPASDPPDERPEPAGNFAVDTALYAYAITRADLSLPGDVPALTEGAHVGLIRGGDLALLVSPLDPGELQLDEDDLSENGRLALLARGHDAVLRAAAACGPVLPLRFGTAVPDDDGARRLLRAHADAARRQLDRIGDAREWGVRLVRTVADPEPVAPRPLHREEISGTEYLSRRRESLAVREREERDAARAADRLDEVLAAHATESLRRGGSPGSSLLLDIACLVAPERETEFAKAVAELVEELRPLGLDVELTGPWPPYSFAALDGPPEPGGRDDA